VIGKTKFFFTAKDAKGAKEIGKNKTFNHKGHPFDSPLARSGQAAEHGGEIG
jgi:hypothetical protein